ncbi:MAG: type II toxin-antitoxin system HicA family toxin [Candidatus Thermoplasmatota archaeon]
MVVGGTRHTVLERDDVQLTVPRHTKLKTRTVAAILKQAGVADWSEL